MLLLNFLSLWLILPILVLCAEDYYKLLGISKNANEKEIKKAYRKLSKQWHPDKNPNDDIAAQKFVEIADAYEAISDSEMRAIYDRYGHEGVEKHKQRKNGPQGARGDPFDLFSRFFGGSGHFGGGRQTGPNMELTLAIPLADFYNGIDSEFTVEKKQICDHCQGSGSDDGKMQTCGGCRGQGTMIQKVQLAPGIVQQMQTTCNQCAGQGKVIKARCRVCGGHRVVAQKETFQMSVEKGMPKGMRLVYENEGDANPDLEAGDLIINLVEREPTLLQEQRHFTTDGTFFRRKGHDLFWREVLSLREAWMGDWTRNLTHLDNHVVPLSRKRGEVIQPGMVEVIKNEGMPLWHGRMGEREEPTQWGDLNIEYVVVLPDQMEHGMEKEFWSIWDKWRKKVGVNLEQDANRKQHVQQDHSVKDEL